MKKRKQAFLEKLHKTQKSLPVFWHHFIPMGVVLCFMALVLVFFSARYTKILAENYMERENSAFVQNKADVETTIHNVYSISESLKNTSAYRQMQDILSGNLPKSGKVVSAATLQNTFNNAFAFLDVPDNADYFVYYAQADTVFSKEQIFTVAEEGFHRFMRFGQMTGEETVQMLKKQKSVAFYGNVSVYDEECVVVVLPPLASNDPFVLGLILPQRTFLQLFGMNLLPENAYFCLQDSRGVEILHRGVMDKNAYEVSGMLMNHTITIGIPPEYFASQTASTRNFSVVLLVLALLLGVVLSVAFSNAGATPLRHLLSSYELSEQDSETRNEIFRLADILESSRRDKEAVGQILSINVLSRVLSGGILTQEEEATLLETYPALAAPCRIAMVHKAESGEDFGQTAITELLAEHLPEDFVCVTVSTHETGVLFPDDADAMGALAQVLLGVNHQLNMDGLSVQGGVSAPFVGVDRAYAAVRQARFSIPIRESSFIEVYSAREDGDDRPGVFSWLTHERLYQAVMKNDRGDTVQFIRNLAEDKYYSAAEAKEVFYNVRFVVRSTAEELHLPLPEADNLEYREERRPKENFLQLEKLASTLFDRLGARQDPNSKNLLDTVVGYVSENFRDPAMSAPVVATHFSLAVKTVYSAVRDKTGMSFNDYLTAVRMKEASRLLCATQKSVDEIAVLCGYPAQSTFYRVFKKYYGDSPNRYRSLQMHE